MLNLPMGGRAFSNGEALLAKLIRCNVENRAIGAPNGNAAIGRRRRAPDD
jgi:hypothetical protein